MRTAEVQAQEVRTEGRTRFPDCPPSRGPGAEQPSLTVPVPPLSHSSYDCLGMRVAVDEMDGGSPHLGTGSCPPPLVCPARGSPCCAVLPPQLLQERHLPSWWIMREPGASPAQGGLRAWLQTEEVH